MTGLFVFLRTPLPSFSDSDLLTGVIQHFWKYLQVNRGSQTTGKPEAITKQQEDTRGGGNEETAKACLLLTVRG